MRTILAILLTCAAGAYAQGPARTEGGTLDNPPGPEQSRKPGPGEIGSNPQSGNAPPPSVYDAQGMSLDARLIDPAKNGAHKIADVQVLVSGVKLVDPDITHEQAVRGEGHLDYRMDWGPVVATTATKLSFHELPAGQHHLEIELVANDETPLGPHKILTFRIPE